MLEPIRHDTQGQSLNLCLGFSFGDAIRKSPWEFRDFRNPPTVLFFLYIDRELHQIASS